MLWFKNIMIYRLKQPIKLSVEQFEQQLSIFAFTPCTSQDMAKSGWIPPMSPNNDTLIHAIPGHCLLCLRKEEKILPCSVIKQELKNKIDKLENKINRKLRKTEKNALKDEVQYTLIPRAFSRFTQTFLWIDLVNNFILINTKSTKKAEDCLMLLRKSIGSLLVIPLAIKKPIQLTLTEWVRSGDINTCFHIQDEAELKGILAESGIVRCKQQDLFSKEIATHLEAGKVVTQIALKWRERAQFILSDNGTIQRLKFFDTLKNQNTDINRANFTACCSADFLLMTSELATLINDLIAELGGEIQY